MRLSLLCGLLLVSVVPAYSQLFSVGVKAGVPLTDGLTSQNYKSTDTTTSTERWLLGPTLEIHLPFRLSFEVDALYRRDNYTVTQAFTRFGQSVNDWQVPFLGKYELHGGFLRPFVDAGVTYRNFSGSVGAIQANSAGFTIGGGITAKLLFVRLSPEFRYTHWGNPASNGGALVSGSGNQGDFLVGFTF